MALIATILVIFGLSLPGLLWAANETRTVPYSAAVATLSLTAMLLLSALISVVIPGGIGAWLPLLLSALISVLLVISGYRRLPSTSDSLYPALLPAAFVILFSAYTYHIGFAQQPDGALAVHNWYNADWFKHLGHSHAVANLGLPAKDIFGGGDTLYYYWLFYMLPAAVAVLINDVGAALYWSNMAVAALFWTMLYGLTRSTGLSAWRASFLTVSAAFLFAFIDIISWLKTGLSITEFIRQDEPLGPVLISMGLYIPQHTIMVSILMAWVIISYLPENKGYNPLSLIALFALAGAGAISTLFGALCLITYGCLNLMALDKDNWRAKVAETAIVGLAAIVFIFWLSILDPGFGRNAIASPIFVEPPSQDSYAARFAQSFARVLSFSGPALLLAIAMIMRWSKATTDKTDKRLHGFAMICIILGLLSAILPEAFMENVRLAREIRLRASFLPAIGATIILGWMLKETYQGGFSKPVITGLLALCAIIALPSFYMRIMWHGQDGPARHSLIPADDVKVLRQLAKISSKDAIIWQYPEAPKLAGGGDDTWVPIIAGRIISASLRATNYTEATDEISAMQRFFAGQKQHIPAHVDWIYLSRDLHAKSYDIVRPKLIKDKLWQKRYCLQDACLFQRVPAKIAQ